MTWLAAAWALMGYRKASTPRMTGDIFTAKHRVSAE